MTARIGVPLPVLDDRRWADLVEEGRALIPFHAPEWTDHNLHDPGITLLELYAAITEQGIFRTDRVSREAVARFLLLAGVTPAGPRPARVVLGFVPPDGESCEVAAGTVFVGTAADDTRVPFRTFHAIRPHAVGSVVLQTGSAWVYVDRTARLTRGDPIPLWGDDPGPGSDFVLGFDRPPAVGFPLSLYFQVRDPNESDRDRERLLVESGPTAVARHHSVQLAWEALGQGDTWFPVAVTDETRALTLNGRVLLSGLDGAGGGRIGRVEGTRFYVRCRIAAGRHDAVPMLVALTVNAVEAEQSRVPPSHSEQHPLDTPPVGDPVAFERLAAGTGWPHQQRTLAERPVAVESLSVFTFEESGWRRWQRRENFDASRRGDAHFRLDPTDGVLTFGDGERGRVPPAGASLLAAYLSTLGSAGNLPANAIRTPAVVQPRPAWGGADGETQDDTTARLWDERAAVTRAITTDDCEVLAESVPGTAVARAAAHSNTHPGLPGVVAAGVVSVVVLPSLPRGRPEPTPELCREVSRHLNRRSVLGTRIEVVGPVYRRVTVTAKLLCGPRARPDDVRQRAAERLAAFFDSLTGGPNGDGWVIGRDVYRSEVIQALDALAGVEQVAELTLTRDAEEPLCSNLCLGPRGLPESGPHAVTVERVRPIGGAR